VLGTSKIGGVISASCAPAPSPEARAPAHNWITVRKHSQPLLFTENSVRLQQDTARLRYTDELQSERVEGVREFLAGDSVRNYC